MSDGYHEAGLSDQASDCHRALTSLKEEIEAVDWYNQRVDVSPNEELKAVLAHNRNEEIEHAIMILEWLRRNMPGFDEQMQTYLFTKLPITEVEEAMGEGEGETAPESGGDSGSGSLGIGKNL